MFRKLSIAALLVLAGGANAQVAKKVANVPLCGTPPASTWGPLLAGILAGVAPAVPLAAGDLSSAVPLTTGRYVGNLFPGACPNPAAAPAGTAIGHFESSCAADILQPVVLNIGAPAGGAAVATPAALQQACAAAVAPLAAATGAANVPCSGEVAVTTNTPKRKFPGSTEFFDYIPAVNYVLVGGFIDDAFAAGNPLRWCVFAPVLAANAARPAGGTGKWAKSYIDSIALGATPIVPAVGMFIDNAAGGAGVLPANAALLAGPLQRLPYATTTTVNYFKSYLNWNQL